MKTLQETIDQILADRRNRLASVEAKKQFWDELSIGISRLVSTIQTAENLNPGALSGITVKVQSAAASANEVAQSFHHISDRFGRNDICIGVGGAGRMGKSTFLQAVTGLGEDQIPTSDMFYTTAGRSLIVNAQQPVAIADMHTESSFLEKVIAPMCKAVKVSAPFSLDEFKRMELPNGETQAEVDVINRLEDTRRALPLIQAELTGEKERHIALEHLRDYVAYPSDGKSKAGKFMAVSNIVIYAPFPESDVKQLRVVDLPGLGEAGRDLAEVQTSGMSNVCDITLLMKRPDEKNVAWNMNDTNALDAMKVAAPLLDDQTKYTAILANVGGETPTRADACVEDIRAQLSKQGRTFQIIRCNAKDRTSILSETMPEVLAFLAKNLPDIDQAILAKVENESKQTQSGLKSTLFEVKDALSQLTRASNGSPNAIRKTLYDKLAVSLTDFEKEQKLLSEKPDEEWNQEVIRVTSQVKKWIADGCGYGSMEKLTQEIAKEILAKIAQPIDTINQLRIAFREQWEVIDEHLQNRIGMILEGFINAIQSATNDFVPPCEGGEDHVEALRKQLNALADKIINAPDQYPEDGKALNGLAAPLRRLSKFDLRFRFHLEPTLIAATEVLISNELPKVKKYDYPEAELFAKEITRLLTEKADEYSKTMITARSGDAAFEKRKRLIEGAVKDPAVCKELLAWLGSITASTQSFCPNRIFAAVTKNAVDAFLRFKDCDDAFAALVRGYESELYEKPSPAIRAALDAYAANSSILQKIQ